MDEFKNNIICGDYESRFVASWIKAGGGRFDWAFKEWLKDLGLSDRDVQIVYNFATNGKLEYQEHAKIWLKERGFDPVPRRRRD